MKRFSAAREIGRRRKRRPATGLVVAFLFASLSSCRCAPQEPAESDEIATTTAVVAPGLDLLTDPDRSPYLQNPVGWTFRVVDFDRDEPIRDFEIGMTTTLEHHLLDDGHGLAYRLVGEVAGPGPVSRRLGREVTPHYHSRVAMIGADGMWLSGEAPTIDGRRVELDEALALRAEEAATWPLPGSAGCRAEQGNVALPIGRIRGLITVCDDFPTHNGPAKVTTVWADQVGFVYREQALDNGITSRDYLMRSDLQELAEPAEGELVLALMPPE